MKTLIKFTNTDIVLIYENLLYVYELRPIFIRPKLGHYAVAVIRVNYKWTPCAVLGRVNETLTRVQNWSMGSGVSEEGPRVVAAGARYAPAEVEARAGRRGARAAGGLGRGRRAPRRRAPRQRAARGGLCERARRWPGAGSARLACLTLPVEGMRVRGRGQRRRHGRVRLRRRALHPRRAVAALSAAAPAPATFAVSVPVPLPLVLEK